MITHHLFPKIFATASISLLAACAAPNWTMVDQQAFTIRAACERQHNNGLIPTELDTERCANATIHQLYADAHYPQMDVLDKYLARREAIANAIDRKTIAPSDAPVKLAEAETEQVAALQQHGLDPVAFNTAPYRVMAACPRYTLQSTLCN
ncbi:MAG TPA: hypothetical protein VHX19_00860 [Stellaceae bacterium]|jgi:hypothetical protein|nr:hypothetical protein [Stellaceae bacterium]